MVVARLSGREERRSYSICAPAGQPLRIGVREVPGGAFSPWLVHDVRPGDRVEVLPPSGTFTPDLSVPGYHVLLAAGSGITPVLSIAGSVLAAGRGSQVTLLYGNRRTDTVMFAEDLADLKDVHTSRLDLVHVDADRARRMADPSSRMPAGTYDLGQEVTATRCAGCGRACGSRPCYGSCGRHTSPS